MSLDDTIEKAERISKKMSGGWWNYRFLEHTVTYTEEEKEHFKKVYHDMFATTADHDVLSDETYYDFIEVYYDGEGKIFAWSDAQTVYCENKKDLRDLLKKMRKAARRNTVILKDGDMIDSGRKMKRSWK